ncbi:MAG: xanthine dehydrogenase family protein molybdopterin-binding subunit [Pirellulaceae bacterium]|nr:xanthine dehydrogenase family protein molybdopterin-binding subunit [Pirellulaceae bacterium]
MSLPTNPQSEQSTTVSRTVTHDAERRATWNPQSARSTSVSRREFLGSLSAGSLVLMGKLAHGQAGLTVPGAVDVDAFAPDYFVSLAPSGEVTILAHRSEMGTGIRTSLPRVVADELEADWARVVIRQAVGDRQLGDQNTDGSNSIRFFFERMRVAGATARTMLERAAAERWGVDASLCFAELHQVKQRGSDKSLSFGELVEAASKLSVPTEAELKLKPRDKWRYIGKDAPITDLDDIVTGKAIFGIDARMDKQLFAVIARPPVVGGQVKKYDDTAAKAIAGVVAVVELPHFHEAPNFQPLGGIAVCANSTWAAWQGRDALEIEWDDGANASYDTDEFAKKLAAVARKPGTVLRATGKATEVIANSKKVHHADYSVPHLAHAPMETPCAVADVKTDAAGKVLSCHVVAATQNPQAVQQAVGRAMDLQPADVLVDVTLLGSGFGRKSKPDYCVEAAMLSRELKRPVHVTWTREDDLQHDYYHAISAIHCEAALDEQGLPQAWLQRAAYPTIGSTFSIGAKLPATWEAEMGNTDLPFDIEHLSLEVAEAESHVRIGWLRSVCHIQQNFAVSSFADELAHLAGRDPLEYLLELLGPDTRRLDMAAAKLGNRGASNEEYPYDIGRLKNVLRRAADRADWKRAASLPRGKGLGIACARSFLGYTGHVIEVDVSPKGQVSIARVWISLDSGTIVSPDRVMAQLQGASVMAATQALYGKLSFKNGRAQQTNYDSYRVATMKDAPREIHIDIVDSHAAPSGVGETGIASFAPALCNAIFAATGKRIRNLPLADHDLSWSS